MTKVQGIPEVPTKMVMQEDGIFLVTALFDTAYNKENRVFLGGQKCARLVTDEGQQVRFRREGNEILVEVQDMSRAAGMKDSGSEQCTTYVGVRWKVVQRLHLEKAST